MYDETSSCSTVSDIFNSQLLTFLRREALVVVEEGLTNADTTADDEVSRAAATTEVKNFMVWEGCSLDFEKRMT